MADLPVSLISPIRVSMRTPEGFFIAAKPSGLKMLALRWSEKPYLFRLEGEHKFHYSDVSTGYHARGVIISDIAIRVDLSTQFDPVVSDEELGSLIISDGRVFVMGIRAGDQWADPVEVPLWLNVNSFSSEEKVGFIGWKIVVRDGDERVTLWSSQEDPEAN